MWWRDKEFCFQPKHFDNFMKRAVPKGLEKKGGERERGCGSEGGASSTVHPLSRHAYSDVLNVETLPMGLVRVVLQGGEWGRGGDGVERRKGMEYGGGGEELSG